MTQRDDDLLSRLKKLTQEQVEAFKDFIGLGKNEDVSSDEKKSEKGRGKENKDPNK